MAHASVSSLLPIHAGLSVPIAEKPSSDVWSRPLRKAFLKSVTSYFAREGKWRNAGRAALKDHCSSRTKIRLCVGAREGRKTLGRPGGGAGARTGPRAAQVRRGTRELRRRPRGANHVRPRPQEDPRRPALRPLVRPGRSAQLRPPLAHPADGLCARRLRGQADHRHPQHLVRPQPLPRALQGPGRRREARRAGGGRLPCRDAGDHAQRKLHEADDDALPQPAGDGGGGADPRASGRWRRADGRLRQDHARR